MWLCAVLLLQDAWLEAESTGAAALVEELLYSEQGWGPGQQQIVEEGRPAWQVDLWPPKAAEEVRWLVSLYAAIGPCAQMLHHLGSLHAPEHDCVLLDASVGQGSA